MGARWGHKMGSGLALCIQSKIGDRPRFFLKKDMSIFTTQKYYEDHEKLLEKPWSVPYFPLEKPWSVPYFRWEEKGFQVIVPVQTGCIVIPFDQK